MEIKHTIERNVLYLYLSGDMDEHASAAARKIVDALIDERESLSLGVINLAGIGYKESTGIGFLIGRYKKLKRYGMNMQIEAPDFSADKVLSLSGVYSLIPKI